MSFRVERFIGTLVNTRDLASNVNTKDTNNFWQTQNLHYGEQLRRRPSLPLDLQSEESSTSLTSSLDGSYKFDRFRSSEEAEANFRKEQKLQIKVKKPRVKVRLAPKPLPLYTKIEPNTELEKQQIDHSSLGIKGTQPKKKTSKFSSTFEKDHSAEKLAHRTAALHYSETLRQKKLAKACFLKQKIDSKCDEKITEKNVDKSPIMGKKEENIKNDQNNIVLELLAKRIDDKLTDLSKNKNETLKLCAAEKLDISTPTNIITQMHPAQELVKQDITVSSIAEPLPNDVKKNKNQDCKKSQSTTLVKIRPLNSKIGKTTVVPRLRQMKKQKKQEKKKSINISCSSSTFSSSVSSKSSISSSTFTSTMEEHSYSSLSLDNSLLGTSSNNSSSPLTSSCYRTRQNSASSFTSAGLVKRIKQKTPGKKKSNKHEKHKSCLSKDKGKVSNHVLRHTVGDILASHAHKQNSTKRSLPKEMCQKQIQTVFTSFTQPQSQFFLSLKTGVVRINIVGRVIAYSNYKTVECQTETQCGINTSMVEKQNIHKLRESKNNYPHYCKSCHPQDVQVWKLRKTYGQPNYPFQSFSGREVILRRLEFNENKKNANQTNLFLPPMLLSNTSSRLTLDTDIHQTPNALKVETHDEFNIQDEGFQKEVSVQTDNFPRVINQTVAEKKNPILSIARSQTNGFMQMNNEKLEKNDFKYQKYSESNYINDDELCTRFPMCKQLVLLSQDLAEISLETKSKNNYFTDHFTDTAKFLNNTSISTSFMHKKKMWSEGKNCDFPVNDEVPLSNKEIEKLKRIHQAQQDKLSY